MSSLPPPDGRASTAPICHNRHVRRQATGEDYPKTNVNSALNTIKVEGLNAWALVNWGDAAHLTGTGYVNDAFGGGQAG